MMVVNKYSPLGALCGSREKYGKPWGKSTWGGLSPFATPYKRRDEVVGKCQLQLRQVWWEETNRALGGTVLLSHLSGSHTVRCKWMFSFTEFLNKRRCQSFRCECVAFEFRVIGARQRKPLTLLTFPIIIFVTWKVLRFWTDYSLKLRNSNKDIFKKVTWYVAFANLVTQITDSHCMNKIFPRQSSFVGHWSEWSTWPLAKEERRRRSTPSWLSRPRRRGRRRLEGRLLGASIVQSGRECFIKRHRYF